MKHMDRERETFVSRRAFLTATGSTLAGTAIAAAPLAMAKAAEPNDEELLSLIREWWTAWDHLEKCHAVLNAAEDRYSDLSPEVPEACVRQEQDVALGLCVPGRVGERYEENIIEQRRGHKWTRMALRPVTEEDRAKHRPLRGATVVQHYEPWPEAQARSNEIIAAWDRYKSVDRQARQASGIDEAERAVSAAINKLEELENRIAHMRALTPRGMLAKARMAAADTISRDGIEGDLESALDSRFSIGHFMGISLIMDLVALNQGAA